jgi:hypothetical protein
MALAIRSPRRVTDAPGLLDAVRCRRLADAFVILATTRTTSGA